MHHECTYFLAGANESEGLQGENRAGTEFQALDKSFTGTLCSPLFSRHRSLIGSTPLSSPRRRSVALHKLVFDGTLTRVQP